MDKKININELLTSGIGKQVKELETGSELLLAYELSKYSDIMLGRKLSLRGVKINERLYPSEVFSFVVTNGLDIGEKIDSENLVDYSKRTVFYFTDTIEGVVFKEFTDSRVHYLFDHDVIANRKLHDTNRSASYVSLVAYLIVKSYKEGKKTPKLVMGSKTYLVNELEYVDLLILQNYGNKLLKEMVEIIFGENWAGQPEWEAFIIHKRQLGYMYRQFTKQEKYKLLTEKFAVGDIVLRYHRSEGTKGNTRGRLKTCYPAIINSITEDQIELIYYPIVQTRMTRIIELDSVDQQNELDEKTTVYTEDDYDQFPTCRELFNLVQIGIDNASFTEDVFILEPLDDDGTVQYYQDEDGSIQSVELSTLDTIYAVFEDRGIKYNKERFVEKFFKPYDRVPKWEEIK